MKNVLDDDADAFVADLWKQVAFHSQRLAPSSS